MVCKLTSCASRRRRGFTLVEYMISASIGVLVLGVGVMLWAYASRNCASLLGYIEMSATSKNALDRISQQVRNAISVQSCASNDLTIYIPGKTGSYQHRIRYYYDKTTKKLMQDRQTAKSEKETTTLLTGCTNFSFQVFQRTPISNSAALYSNNWKTNTAKVVQMQWTCIRQITGSQSSLENQVSAKVIIRNQ